MFSTTYSPQPTFISNHPESVTFSSPFKTIYTPLKLQADSSDPKGNLYYFLWYLDSTSLHNMVSSWLPARHRCYSYTHLVISCRFCIREIGWILSFLVIVCVFSVVVCIFILVTGSLWLWLICQVDGWVGAGGCHGRTWTVLLPLGICEWRVKIESMVMRIIKFTGKAKSSTMFDIGQSYGLSPN